MNEKSFDFLSGNHRERHDAQLSAVVANDVVPHHQNVAHKGRTVCIAQLHFADRLAGAHVPDNEARSLPTSH